MGKSKGIFTVGMSAKDLLQRAVAGFGSITGLARALDMNRMAVSSWVHGRRTPTAASLLKLREVVERGPLGQLPAKKVDGEVQQRSEGEVEHGN